MCASLKSRRVSVTLWPGSDLRRDFLPTRMAGARCFKYLRSWRRRDLDAAKTPWFFFVVGDGTSAEPAPAPSFRKLIGMRPPASPQLEPTRHVVGKPGTDTIAASAFWGGPLQIHLVRNYACSARVCHWRRRPAGVPSARWARAPDCRGAQICAGVAIRMARPPRSVSIAVISMAAWQREARQFRIAALGYAIGFGDFRTAHAEK